MKYTLSLLLLLLLPVSSFALDYETFLEPYQIIDLSSPYRDRLEKILVHNGEQVKQGQVLAEIGAGVLKAQLTRAREAASLHGEIDAAKAMVSMRTNRLAMLNKLKQSGNTRPQELKTAETELSMAKAQLQTARETQKLRELDQSVIQAQLSEKILKSPIDGVVRKVYKQEGELTGGVENEPLMTLIQLDPLRAVFYLPPGTAHTLHQGEQTQIRVEEVAVPATIAHISPVIDPQSGTVEVQLEIANPEGQLVAGRRCQLLLLGESDHVRGTEQTADQSTLQ